MALSIVEKQLIQIAAEDGMLAGGGAANRIAAEDGTACDGSAANLDCGRRWHYRQGTEANTDCGTLASVAAGNQD